MNQASFSAFLMNQKKLSGPVRPWRHCLLASMAMMAVILATGWAGASTNVDNGAVVLMYHRFGESRYPSTNIRMEQFAAHLRELAKPQYSVLPLSRVVAAILGGQTLPDRTVAITIDDAYASVHSRAWPLLKAAGLPFTLFVATAPVEKNFAGMLSWTRIREMVEEGRVELGAHSESHAHLPDLSQREIEAELARGDRLLFERAGVAPTLLAYPYGETSLQVRGIAIRQGYKAAFGQHSGVVSTADDAFALPRFALNERYGSLERFRRIVNALPLPVSAVLPREGYLRDAPNPPALSFRVPGGVEPLSELRCYASNLGLMTTNRLAERRLEARFAGPLPFGRSRVNCTLRDVSGRWRWWGRQFYRPRM